MLEKKLTHAMLMLSVGMPAEKGWGNGVGTTGAEIGTVGTTWADAGSPVPAVGVAVAVPEPVARAPELEATLAAVDTMLEAGVVQPESLRRTWG